MTVCLARNCCYLSQKALLVNGEKEGSVGDQVLQGIWTRRFKDPLIKANTEQFKAQVNDYMEQGESFDKAFHHAANLQLPGLRKQLRLDYA